MRANSRFEAWRLAAALVLSTLAAGSSALDRPKRGSHVVIPLSGRTQAKMTAYGLNNGGDIVGSEGSGVGERAVFRYRDGTYYAFTGYSGSSRLLSVNDRGDVAGMSSPDTNFARALWGYGGLLLLADSTSIARSINNDRRIVGQKTPQGADWIWSPVDDVHTQYLASLGPSTIFRDVNAEGAICGDYKTPNGSAIQGLFYDPQTSQYTALLYGTSTRNFAYALNNSRKVVGYTVEGAIDQMTVWDIAAQTATRLGQGVALDINDSDWIVGYDGAGSRFRTPQDGFMNLEEIAEGSDAAPERWTISNAYRVNNRGEMLAVAAKGISPKRDVLVSPILRIDDVRLADVSKLKVLTWRAFGRNPDDRFWVDFTVTIGNKVIRRRVTPLRNINADGTYTDATPEVFDLQAEGVPRFQSDIEIVVEATVGKGTRAIWTDRVTKPVLLPVVLIPGIDPTSPGAAGGDGTWPSLEAFLAKESKAKLCRTSPVTGDSSGYTLDSNGYRTIYTLAFDRNNDPFAAAAANLNTLWINQIQPNTWADRFKIVAHSKGGLVGRYYTKRFAQRVERLIMVQSPHAGSLFPIVVPNLAYNYTNLYPAWNWASVNGGAWQVYPGYFNAELTALNGEVLPPGPIYVIYYAKDFKTWHAMRYVGIPGQFTQIPTFGDGDRIVPEFSQRGFTVDWNVSNNWVQLPAFVGVPLTVETPLTNWHSASMESREFMWNLMQRHLANP